MAALGFARSFQEVAITALNQSHAVACQPNGGLAESVSGPGSLVDLMGREEHGSDRAIGRVLEARVDRTEHLLQTFSTLRRHARIGRNCRAAQTAPVSCQRFQAVGRRIVEKNDRRFWWLAIC